MLCDAQRDAAFCSVSAAPWLRNDFSIPLPSPSSAFCASRSQHRLSCPRLPHPPPTYLWVSLCAALKLQAQESSQHASAASTKQHAAHSLSHAIFPRAPGQLCDHPSWRSRALMFVARDVMAAGGGVDLYHFFGLQWFGVVRWRWVGPPARGVALDRLEPCARWQPPWRRCNWGRWRPPPRRCG